MLQLDAGGSERVVLDLARNLNLFDFDIYVAAFKGGVLEPKFREVCKEIFFIEKKTGLDLSAMLKLSKIVAQNSIDVVNAHHYMPCFYSFLGTRLLNRKRLLYTEHSVPEVVNVFKSIHGKLFNWMLYRMNSVIGVSRGITDEFKRSYPRHAEKFIEILNGVDIEKFTCRDHREKIRKEFGFSSEHFVVGMVANFRKVKNHACLIRAIARLENDCPQLSLLLVGTGFYGDTENSEGDIRRMIEDFDLGKRVIFAGYQGDVPTILSALDAFCLPSFSEGLPVSVLEAMAAGVPIIGSNVKGISEVVEDNKTGLLFNSNNCVELSHKIYDVIHRDGLADKLADNAFTFVSDRHSLTEWIDKTKCAFFLMDRRA